MKHLISGIAFALVGLFVGCKQDIDKHVDKVQLWEGGPYWAMTNIGAEEPWECGLYFWWGDTIGYRRENNAWVASNGSSSNFQFCHDPKSQQTSEKSPAKLLREEWVLSMNDIYVLAPEHEMNYIYVLAPEHDAAHVHWGGRWRMPTEYELDALERNCDWTWTTQNGVNGYVVRGRGDFSEKSIFLPACGYGVGALLRNDSWMSFQGQGPVGYYWSSVFDTSGYGNGLCFDSGFHGAGSADSRSIGRSVRPVQGGNE